ncbi:unnamed protein product [Cylicocyclus nassatus]|uniref:Uncharacterized protein n=1 Tax=Cylicocyclus nassatus TaxID=53992 RepID=A0AA36M6F8_CYLNA|nr:unnamed protein product [Cylicocyclus nassatus]
MDSRQENTLFRRFPKVNIRRQVSDVLLSEPVNSSSSAVGEGRLAGFRPWDEEGGKDHNRHARRKRKQEDLHRGLFLDHCLIHF